MSLRDKVILITGAGRGIGEGLARDLGAQAARIGVHYLNEDAAAQATCEAIRAAGGQAEAFKPTSPASPSASASSSAPPPTLAGSTSSSTTPDSTLG